MSDNQTQYLHKLWARNPTTPRASNFNQTMDIKYKTRFAERSQPYILYMVDAFTRYKSAVFIPDKSATTVVEAFLVNWIRIFGRSCMVHFDRGNEFINYDKYNIKITSTASYSPNQNVAFIMAKIMTADPNCSPEIALTWAINASNVSKNS